MQNMPKYTLKELMNRDELLVLPCAYDALSARLTQQAGFQAYCIGGFPLIASRLGLPDIGLASFGEISSGVRDIVSACSLPVLVDGDDGYGDVKNITRTVQVYESIGVGGISFEDQTSPKRCGHMAGKSVVPTDVFLRKLEAALHARRNDETVIVARTDARGVNGLDDALARGHRYLAAGADALFVEAPQSIEEIERIASEFKAPLIINMVETGRTPILPFERLQSLGFSMVILPSTLFLRAIMAMRRALIGLREGRLETEPDMITFAETTAILGLPEWGDIDDQFGTSG